MSNQNDATEQRAQNITTIRANLEMVLARLDSDPRSAEEWRAIVGALHAAEAAAYRECDKAELSE